MQKHEVKLVAIVVAVSVVAFGIMVDGYFGFPMTSAASQWMLVLACLLTLGILLFYGYRFLAQWYNRRSKIPPAPKKTVHIPAETPQQEMVRCLDHIRTILLLLLVVTVINNCSNRESIRSIERAVNSTWEIKPRRF